MKVVWTQTARDRLAAIEDFIAVDDPAAAARFSARLLARTRALATFPESGRRVPELPRAPLREVIVGNYRIIYRVATVQVEVITVFEGHRLLRREELPTDDP